LGCSPIKAVRELGLERRETVDNLAVYKLGYMLETPRILHYCLRVIDPDGSENVTDAVNQQERLEALIVQPESSETICQAPLLTLER
jgi:hypothetical protein